MKIKIQIQKDLNVENIINTHVSEENDLDVIIGKIIEYNSETGIAICEIFEK